MQLMGLTEMMMNLIPLNRLMIRYLVVMVVVLVNLLVEEGQVPLQVYWCPPLSYLKYLEVCPPGPSTSSYPIRSSSWGLWIHPQTLCLPFHFFILHFFPCYCAALSAFPCPSEFSPRIGCTPDALRSLVVVSFPRYTLQYNSTLIIIWCPWWCLVPCSSKNMLSHYILIAFLSSDT